jgi:hypothetical protein
MKRTVLTFGLISGALSSLMMVATVPFADKIGPDKGRIIGYTTLVLSFLPCFSASTRTGTTWATARSRSLKRLPSGSALP